MAGDTYLLNFQPTAAPIPTRYLADTGQVFGSRGNGLSYGWSSDHTDQSRDRGVNPDHITLARTLGASESQIFRKFTLPSAVPVIFNGLRLGLVFALLGVIGGEIIASEHGLGQTLSVLAASFKTNGVFGVIILLALIGVAITWGMTWLENRLLRWR